MPIASRKEPLVPSFAVTLNDQPLANDIALWIVGVTVEDSLDKPSMFTLQLISKEDERSTQAWTDDPRLALGAEVEISMGYGDDLETLIIGDITGLEPTFTSGGPPTLVVRGFDRRNRLNGVSRFRQFSQLTDAEIASQVCADRGLSSISTDTEVTYDQVLQEYETDLAFLVRRAHRIGYELAMDGTAVLFRPIANGAPAVATLTLNDDLLEFQTRLSLEPVSQVRVLSWDPKSKAPIGVSAKSDSAPAMDGLQLGLEKIVALFGDAVETVVRPTESVAEADAVAVGNFRKAALEYVQGDGTARGRTDIRAGKVIALEKLGQIFDGSYYVESATHRYSPRAGYLTNFHVKRNAS